MGGLTRKVLIPASVLLAITCSPSIETGKMKSTVGTTNRSRTARDGRFPSQVDRWGLNHAPEESLTYKNFSFIYKFKAAIGGHRSKPDVFPIATTALTTNSAGGGSQALKVLVAWT